MVMYLLQVKKSWLLWLQNKFLKFVDQNNIGSSAMACYLRKVFRNLQNIVKNVVISMLIKMYLMDKIIHG